MEVSDSAGLVDHDRKELSDDVSKSCPKDVVLELSYHVSSWEVVTDDEDASVTPERLSHANLFAALPDHLREMPGS